MKNILILILIILSACSTQDQGNHKNRNKVNNARVALADLYESSPGTQALAAAAKAVLIFPEITKAGFVVGGQYGEGVLFRNGEARGFYSSKGASYGLQAGVQKFGYAMFFMTEKDLQYLSKSEGWEVGVGPTLTVVDSGFAKSISTTSVREGVYVYFFDQRGLMAGLGVQGTKITKIE